MPVDEGSVLEKLDMQLMASRKGYERSAEFFSVKEGRDCLVKNDYEIVVGQVVEAVGAQKFMPIY